MEIKEAEVGSGQTLNVCRAGGEDKDIRYERLHAEVVEE